jgi:hypothetical protein
MKAVFQTRYGKEHGNCFQACLASILEMKLDDVPDFCNIVKDPFYQWQIETNKWLRQFGLAMVTVDHNFNDDICNGFIEDCYIIATGNNHDGVRHCVVWRNGEIVHNPNKYCKGIKPDSIDIIFPLEANAILDTKKDMETRDTIMLRAYRVRLYVMFAVFCAIFITLLSVILFF